MSKEHGCHYDDNEESIYTDDDIAKMAKAVGVGVDAVIAQRHMLESAALWYKMLVSGNDLARSGSTGLAPSELKRKYDSIQSHVNKIISAIGINPDENEGSQVFDDLSYFATDEMVVSWIRTLVNLKSIAEKAAQSTNYDYSVERHMVEDKSNIGDTAINHWVGDVMSIFEKITGKRPSRAVYKAGTKQEGEEFGPLIDFCRIAGAKISLPMNADAWGSRIRRVLAKPTTM